jgi:hypothetical protein
MLVVLLVVLNEIVGPPFDDERLTPVSEPAPTKVGTG